MSEYQPKYWSGKGKYQRAYEALNKILQIPDMGNAPTRDGELLRKMSNRYYDRFNNGVGRLSAEEMDRRVDVLVSHLAAKYFTRMHI